MDLNDALDVIQYRMAESFTLEKELLEARRKIRVSVSKFADGQQIGTIADATDEEMDDAFGQPLDNADGARSDGVAADAVLPAATPAYDPWDNAVDTVPDGPAHDPFHGLGAPLGYDPDD